MILRRLATALLNMKWGIVLTEVFIVIFGVYVGIWLGNLNEARGEAAEAEASLADIEANMARALINTAERLAIEPCRLERLPVLVALLSEDGENWPGAGPEEIEEAADTSGYWREVPIPIRAWETTAWDTAISTGAASYFDEEAFEEYAMIFQVIRHLQRWQDEELRLLGRLGQLNHAGPINTTVRRTALADLMERNMLSSYIAVASGQLQEAILEVPRERLPAITEAQFKADVELFESMAPLGACVNHAAYEPVLELRRSLVRAEAP